MADGSHRTPTLRSRLTASGGALAPFSHPAFATIWIATLVSQMGAMIQSVAAAWLMTELTRSHQLVAAVQAAVSLPILVLGVPAGAIADNFDRRRVMLVAQWGLLLVSAALTVLTLGGMIGPWGLLAFTLAVGAGGALNGPAWQASVRAQVGAKDLPQAVSLNAIAFNLARSVGPALGGILILVAGIGAAFAINAASYVALIWVLTRWRPEVPPPVRQPMLPSIRAGVSFCIHSDPVRRVLLRGFCVGLGASGFHSLLPVVVRDRLHGGELSFGLVLGMFGLGSILAALFVSGIRRRLGTETVTTFGVLAFVVAMPLLARVETVGPALPVSFLAGIGWTACMTTINVAMQVRSPDEFLGRCMSIYLSVVFGGMAAGAWLWGAIADWISLPAALYGTSLWLLVALVGLRLLAPMPAPHEGRISRL
ncbi:MAG: MFS transporter [Pseudomonadota bacterium]